MCYSEHVFHSICGHWGSTRIYQKCPNADRVGYERGCWNSQSTGSVSVNSLCDRCLFDPEAITNRGTYLSVYQAQAGKDAGLCPSKKRNYMALRSEKSPGFFGWRPQN
jgi:hypothetical protein